MVPIFKIYYNFNCDPTVPIVIDKMYNGESFPRKLLIESCEKCLNQSWFADLLGIGCTDNENDGLFSYT